MTKTRPLLMLGALLLAQALVLGCGSEPEGTTISNPQANPKAGDAAKRGQVAGSDFVP